MPLENMGAVGGFVNTGESLANIDNTRSLIAEREIMNQARMFALKQSIATQSAMQEAAAEQYGVKPAPPPGMQSMEGLSPDAAAALESSDTPGKINMGGMEALMGGGPKASDRHMAEYQREQALAKKIAATGGKPEVHEAAMQRAGKALTEATAAQDKERQDAIVKAQSFRDLFGAAKDEESLNNTVIPQAMAQWGPQAVQGFIKQSGLDVDPNTGRLLWSPKNIKAIEAVQDLALKQSERLKAGEREQDRIRKQEAVDEKARHNREQEEQAARNEELRRATLDLHKTVVEQANATKRREEATKAERFEQSQLQKDPVYRDYDKYAVGKEMATSVISSLAKGDVKALDAPTAKALAVAFNNMTQGYRANVGGKYSSQEVAQMNGLWQKVNKYVSSFGEGTPIVDVTTARDMANAMSQIIANVDKTTVARVLDAQEKVAIKHGDPNMITMKGDVNALIQSGALKRKEEGNVVTLTMGNKTWKFKREDE